MSMLTWVAEQAFKRGAKTALGPVVGTMVVFAQSGIKLVDKQFAEADRDALKRGRALNGGCEHMLLAFSSGTFSEGSTGEANDGDRQVTMAHGKRFSYKDIPRCFWHPSVSFLPAGNLSGIWIGSEEEMPTPSSGATLSAASPVQGRPTCPFCQQDTEKMMKEIEKHRNFSSRNKGD
jgi:hypothetical protein